MILETLMTAICLIESSGDPLAFNFQDGKGRSNHSFGYCQVNYATAVELGFKPNKACLKDYRDKKSRTPIACGLFSESVNKYYATTYLNLQLIRYDYNFTKAISSYNAGSYITGNREYVRKVKKKYQELLKAEYQSASKMGE